MAIIRGVDVDGPEPEDRPRRWVALFRDGMGQGLVVLMHHAIREPDEHISERVPEQRMTWAEWETTHADYGLAVDGTPVADG